MTTDLVEQPTESITFEDLVLPLERVPCDFCGSLEFHPFWSRMRHGLNLPTVFCQRCGLCQTNPQPTAVANNLFYSHLYNRFHKRTEMLTLESNYVAKSRRIAKPRFELLSRFLDPQSTARVLEIGAGVGQFQVTARQRSKWQMAGIEPGGEQSAICQQQGLDVQHAFFQEANVETASQDAVVSFHVLEHLASPSEFLRFAHRIVKPGGLLHLEVPNLARWGEGSLDNFLQFPHLFSFSATTLRNYLTANGGFRVVYSSEMQRSLTMIAVKTGEPMAERPIAFEQYDVTNFMTRLRLMDRSRRATAWIPNWSVLKKIRSTFELI